MHEQRMNYRAASPATYEAIAAAEAHIRKCGLEYSLIELVKMRASQINHCAYCLDRHSKDARSHSLTLLPTTGAPDADYEALKGHFTEKEIVDLTVLIGLINLWNRIGVGFRLQHPK
jgi:AhpD family alkylhydroperoxidase